MDERKEKKHLWQRPDKHRPWLCDGVGYHQGLRMKVRPPKLLIEELHQRTECLARELANAQGEAIAIEVDGRTIFPESQN